MALAASRGGHRGRSPEVAVVAGGCSFGLPNSVDVIDPASNGGKFLPILIIQKKLWKLLFNNYKDKKIKE